MQGDTKLFICSVVVFARDDGEKVNSLYRSRKYPAVPAKLYLYKSLIKPKMDDCCHI